MRPDSWTRMHSAEGQLVLSVTVNGKSTDIVFDGRDLDDLHKHVQVAIATRK